MNLKIGVNVNSIEYNGFINTIGHYSAFSSDRGDLRNYLHFFELQVIECEFKNKDIYEIKKILDKI